MSSKPTHGIESFKERSASKLRDSSKRKVTREFSFGKGGPSSKQSSLVLPVVMIGNEDVTPASLNPFIYEGSRERAISIQDTMTKDSFIMMPPSIVNRVDSQRFHATLLQQKQETENYSIRKKSFVASSIGEDIMSGIEMSVSSFQSEYFTDVRKHQSEVEITLDKIPQQISLILQETETEFLLSLAGCTTYRGTEEADLIEEDNKTYEYLTKGKGRNRKVLAVAVQTLPLLMKARDTETDKKLFADSSTFVSTWEMFDTLNPEDGEESDEGDGEEEFHSDEEYGVETSDTHKLNREASQESYRMSSEDKQIVKVVRSKAFFDALIVIERILGNNTFNTEQKRFKDLIPIDLFDLDKVYKYDLHPLWTYGNDDTEGQCVTRLAFNSHNEDMVAVAYGKYYYSDRQFKGMVMIWNFKNPQQPERQYSFLWPVTSIAFSKLNPNVLAVGLYNGHIQLVDVSKKELSVIRENTVTSFEPLWEVLWFQQGDEEDLMASFGDGKVYKFQIRGAHQLKTTQIMITAAAEGRLKGIIYLKKCELKDISINRYEEARCLALHPVDPYTYFVGTSEGVVHKCSTNYYNEHMDVYKAHDGAIHSMKFSPFTNKLYLTCGDDFRFRLWLEGISEPLVTSEPSITPVLDVDWSPVHPTVVVSIRGPDIMVWDMQRKMYEPQSLTKCANNVFNTVCRFTPNGSCLMVGDMAGNVKVYSLEDMPIPPFFPEWLVMKSLKKLLVTKPDLLKKVLKQGSLNFSARPASKYFQ